MIKIQKRTVTIVIMALVFTFMSFSNCFSATNDNITKEYSLKSSDTDFKCDAPKTIKEDGKSYELIGVKYKTNKVLKPESKTIVIKKLKSQKVTPTKKFNIDGNIVKLKIDTNNLIFSEEKGSAVTKTTTKTNCITQPNFASTMRFSVNKNGIKQTVTGKLQGIVPSLEKQVPFIVSGKFIGYGGSAYSYRNGDIVLSGKTNPIWQGYERQILESFNLNPQVYDITSASWVGSARMENGNRVRNCSFSGNRTVRDYTATYTTSSGAVTGYTATATYSNGITDTEYDVTAICIYEKINSGLAKALLGAGIGVLLASIVFVLILYVLRRKKNAKRDLFI